MDKTRKIVFSIVKYAVLAASSLFFFSSVYRFLFASGGSDSQPPKLYTIGLLLIPVFLILSAADIIIDNAANKKKSEIETQKASSMTALAVLNNASSLPNIAEITSDSNDPQGTSLRVAYGNAKNATNDAINEILGYMTRLGRYIDRNMSSFNDNRISSSELKQVNKDMREFANEFAKIIDKARLYEQIVIECSTLPNESALPFKEKWKDINKEHKNILSDFIAIAKTARKCSLGMDETNFRIKELSAKLDQLTKNITDALNDDIRIYNLVYTEGFDVNKCIRRINRIKKEGIMSKISGIFILYAIQFEEFPKLSISLLLAVIALLIIVPTAVKSNTAAYIILIIYGIIRGGSSGILVFAVSILTGLLTLIRNISAIFIFICFPVFLGIMALALCLYICVLVFISVAAAPVMIITDSILSASEIRKAFESRNTQLA